MSATFDVQDRIESFGPASYEHNAMGQWTSKTISGQTTSYDYDELGNLMEVALPMKTVSYVVDSQGSRVACEVDGMITNRCRQHRLW